MGDKAKYISIWFVTWILVTTLLTACGDASVTEVQNDGSARFKGLDGRISIITDIETGCKYIFLEHGIGDSRTEAMSPLLKNSKEFDCE